MMIFKLIYLSGFITKYFNLKYFYNLKKKFFIFDWKFSRNLNFFQKFFFSERRNFLVKTTDKQNKNDNKIKLIFFKYFCANKDLIYPSK